MDFLSGITSAIALGISIVLLLATWGWVQQGKGEKQTHYYLLALLTVICLQLFELIYHSFDLHRRWPIFIKLVDPIVVMAPFLLFAYISGLKGRVVILKGKGLLHLLPALYVLAWDVPFWLLAAEDKIFYMDQGFLTSEPWTLFVPYRSDYLVILASLTLFYWWQANSLLSANSGPISRIDELIQRVRQAMLLLAVWMMVCAMTGYGEGTNFILSTGAGILVGYLCYFFLLQARLPKMSHVESSVKDSIGDVDSATSNAEPLVSGNTVEQSEVSLAYGALEKQLSQGLFQDNELSLAKLAEASGLNIHLASKAINECSGGNFYDWVNLYRVDKAKSLLLESNAQVSRICFDVGFNSKSTFYAAFKKVTGLTPGAYRKLSKN
ncbi:MAG: AraC family transcriptional regulator [Oleispira sp.]